MSILTVILVIIIAGFLLWVVNRLIPMDPIVKNILYVVIVLVLVLWLLQVFGILGTLSAVRIR